MLFNPRLEALKRLRPRARWEGIGCALLGERGTDPVTAPAIDPLMMWNWIDRRVIPVRERLLGETRVIHRLRRDRSL